MTAELYKLLIYDQGAFFKAHRDTEKADGMFGTLVLVLPSAHRGGELAVRHAGREVILDLSGGEFTELTFAAFYADCEHEVRPITSGNRVCLVFNLIQPRASKEHPPLKAPSQDPAIAAAAAMLESAFATADAPAKLTWLLEHHYSPAGLAFAGLKGADAALASVLRQAGERAGCAIHLGMLHLQEFGAAEETYEPPSRGGRGWYHEDDDAVDEEESDENEFEVIEVTDAWHYVDQWRDTTDHPMAYGQLPLVEGEVLPADALKGIKPDNQHLTEATGNEGASFDRSYLRAALVIWPRARFADVLLQAGVGATLPYLETLVRARTRKNAPAAARGEALAVARRILLEWATETPRPSYRGEVPDPIPDRGKMAALLAQLEDTGLLEQFLAKVVTRDYNGDENEALAAVCRQLTAQVVEAFLVRLARERGPTHFSACVDLLARLFLPPDQPGAADWTKAGRTFGTAILEVIPRLKSTPSKQQTARDLDSMEKKEVKPPDAATVSALLESLATFGTPDLRMAASAVLIANPAGFDPVTVIIPALAQLSEHASRPPPADYASRNLWLHAAQYLLVRAENPPELPRDWHQEVGITCGCADCRELQVFARDPLVQVQRFRVRKDRRQHLHQQIQINGLDMTHITERLGSPLTLVCTKTRRSYRLQCKQHLSDLAAMDALIRLAGKPGHETAALVDRMKAARERKSPAG